MDDLEFTREEIMNMTWFMISTIVLLISCSTKKEGAEQAGRINTDSTLSTQRVVQRRGIIERLPGKDSLIALTFDACETKTPSHFDSTILNYLLRNEIPFTVFLGGKFATRNSNEVRALAQFSFVEIENHSVNHYEHMEKLDSAMVIKEVLDNEELIYSISGRRTKYFRFPAGNYDVKTLRLIEDLGYAVVHWTFPSGDPDKKVTPVKLQDWVISKSRPGNIHIFHINRRGYSTGKALPVIVTSLKKRGYRFVKLDEAL